MGSTSPAFSKEIPMADGMRHKTTPCYMCSDDRGVLRTKIRATNADQVPRDSLGNLESHSFNCRLCVMSVMESGPVSISAKPTILGGRHTL